VGKGEKTGRGTSFKENKLDQGSQKKNPTRNLVQESRKKGFKREGGRVKKKKKKDEPFPISKDNGVG